MQNFDFGTKIFFLQNNLTNPTYPLKSMIASLKSKNIINNIK